MAENTNYYQVLDLAGVQQLWNTCKATFIQTVNGNGPDANGNVNVSGGGTTYKHNILITILSTQQQYGNWKGRLSLLIENTTNSSFTSWNDIKTYLLNRNKTKIKADGVIYSNRAVITSWIALEGNNANFTFYGYNLSTGSNDATGQDITTLDVISTFEDVIL